MEKNWNAHHRHGCFDFLESIIVFLKKLILVILDGYAGHHRKYLFIYLFIKSHQFLHSIMPLERGSSKSKCPSGRHALTFGTPDFFLGGHSPTLLLVGDLKLGLSTRYLPRSLDLKNEA